MTRVHFLASEILGGIRKVRVQLEGTNYLHMSEVQVFDKNGVNRALNKPATQSSTLNELNANDASRAVNGVLNDLTHTKNDAGKHYTQEQLANSNRLILCLTLVLF